MRTNPHSRHGKCGRLRCAGILDARAKADDARQVEEMRRKMGLPAGFRSVQTLSATDEGIDWAPDEDLAIGGSTREEGLEDCKERLGGGFGPMVSLLAVATAGKGLHGDDSILATTRTPRFQKLKVLLTEIDLTPPDLP